MSAGDTESWRPTATLAALQERAGLLAAVRRFFAERKVLEVDTPLLASHSVTDPQMDVISTDNPLGRSDRYFLQSSPEYAMKRLLAAGSGPIYQLGKAFRRAELGSRHNPEFTMLEWYRPGFDDRQLMDEIDALLASTLAAPAARRVSYRAVFTETLGIDPAVASIDTLAAIAARHNEIVMPDGSVDDWLNFLMSHLIEPQLGFDRPCCVYDYPASQAALAKIAPDQDGVPVARRFEVFCRGMELANGYHELIDVAEQRRRFAADRTLRAQLGRPDREPDPYLMAALEAGLPDCAGVALGFDRLLMLKLGCQRIADVLPIPTDRA